MPFLRLTLTSAELDNGVRTRLQQGLTQLMVTTLRKQAALTVVAVEHAPATTWSVGGAALTADGWSAQLEVFITAGTNDSKERGRFLAEADQLICGQWTSPPNAPLYIVVNEVPDDSWGYDGMTQADRRAHHSNPSTTP